MLIKPNFFDAEQELFFSGQFNEALKQMTSKPENTDEKLTILALFGFLLGLNDEALHYLNSIIEPTQYSENIYQELCLKYFLFEKIESLKSFGSNEFDQNFRALDSTVNYFKDKVIFDSPKVLSDEVQIIDEKYFWVIEIYLSGKKLRGLLDTGASFFLCLDSAILEHEIQSKNAIRIDSFTLKAPLGEFPSETVCLQNVVIGKNQIKNVPCMSFSLDSINKVTDQTVSFILGNAWLRNHPHIFDFEKNSLIINPEKINHRPPTRLKYISDSDQKIYTPIELNGVQGLALWDSGSTTGFLCSQKLLLQIFEKSHFKTLQGDKIEDQNHDTIIGPNISLTIQEKELKMDYSVASKHIDHISEALGIPILCSIGSGIREHLKKICFLPEQQEMQLYWRH